MNIIKEFMRLLGSIFCGADLFILHMCKEDKVDFIKKELGIFIIASMTIYVTYGTYLWGIFVLLLYKMFLSNLNIVSKGDESYSFLKWLISTFLAIGLIVALMERGIIIDFVTVIYSFYSNISRIIISGIIIVCILMFCYFPVRFNMSKGTLYAKLYNQYLISEQNRIETNLKEQLEKQEYVKNIQDIVNKQVESEYIKRISGEIIESRMRVAKLVLEKWEKEQKQKIETNIEEYINKLK
jgi:hypothetical protein